MQGAEPINTTNGTPNTSTSNSETRFNILERTLEQFQENARCMGVVASDFTSRSQETLNQRVHTLISGLQELDQLKDQFVNVPIPLELLDYLDQCKNPQLYTKECMQRTLQKNKEVNGKNEMYNKFYANLLSELAAEMPDETRTYYNMRHSKQDQESG